MGLFMMLSSGVDEKVKARVTIDIIKECDEVRLSGAHRRESQSSFLGYLIELGLAKYNKIILPAEQSNDELTAKGASVEVSADTIKANGASAEVSVDTIKAKGFKSMVKT
jgi:hypothetical protein